MSIILSCIQNFKDHVDLCIKDDKEILKLVDKRENPAYVKTLYDIKTLDDFKHWEKNVGKYLITKPVQKDMPSTLDRWFE